MRTFFKILAAVFAVLFIWAAYLQNNDPDPYVWYIIYGSAALACILFLLNRFPFSLAVLMALGYLVGAYFFWPDRFEGVEIGEGEINNIEHARESLGLIINALVVFVLGWRSRW